MKHLIDKDALVAEIDRRIASLESFGSENYLHDNCPEQYAMLVTLKSLIFSIDTLEVKEVDLENYNKVKKLLSSSFMHFLDANRPEGKMCLSNGECFDIEKAFDELDFAKLFRYMEKYLKAQKGE